MSASSSSIPTTLPAHYVLGTLELTENARTEPSPYNTIQTYLIEAAEQFKVFQDQVTDVINKFELQSLNKWHNYTHQKSLELSRIFYSDLYEEGRYYTFPESLENNILAPILERFTKYSAYPQRKDQIYELFALLHCRSICKKMALDEHLIPDLQSIVQGYIGEGLDEFKTKRLPLELILLKDSLETIGKNIEESALVDAFERVLEKTLFFEGTPEKARSAAIEKTLGDALLTALNKAPNTILKYIGNNFDAALQVDLTTLVPETSTRNALGKALKNALETIIKKIFEEVCEHEEKSNPDYEAIGDFMLSNLPFGFSLVDKVKLAALEASFERNTHADFSVDRLLGK